MNNKKFLDNLDSGWGDVISNTYEEANKLVFIDEKRNIYTQVDPSAEIINDDNKSYTERYNITNNPNYYMDVEMRVDKFTPFGKSIMFILTVCDSTIEDERKKILTLMTVQDRAQYSFTPDIEDRRVQIDRGFMNSFIRRGYNKVTSKPENQRIFKFSKSLQTIINNLNANALVIK